MNSLEAMSPLAMMMKSPKARKIMSPALGQLHGGGTVKEDGSYKLKAGEKVIPTDKPGQTLIHSGADRPMRPMPTNRECVPHEKVEAMPNTDGGMHTGHWEIDGNDVKFVK